MKKYLIIYISLIFSTLTYADLTIKTNDSIGDHLDLIEVEEAQQYKVGDDLTAIAVNYKSFESLLVSYVVYMKKLRAKNEFVELCSTHDMAHKFLINNIKYAGEYNSKYPDLTYEKLLELILKDQLQNKKGCDGEVPFNR